MAFETWHIKQGIGSLVDAGKGQEFKSKVAHSILLVQYCEYIPCKRSRNQFTASMSS